MNFGKPEKSEFWKKRRKLLETSFYLCVPKSTIICSPFLEIVWDITFCHSGSFFALFPPLATQKIKIFKKYKKTTWRHHYFTQVEPKIVIIYYTVPETQHVRFNFYFSFWAIFCPFTTLTAWKKKISKKWKMPEGIISLHKRTKNHDHMPYCSWDMAHDRWKFFTLGYSGISSYYTTLPKIMIICYNVPEIWCVTDVIVVFHFGLLFALLQPKKLKFQKIEKNT